MIRSFRHSVVVALVVLVGLTAGCRGGKNKVASEEAREGRDRALLGEGIKEMQDGRLSQARLLFNTLINTYPDSPLLPVTKLAQADSFYREGSFASMGQAEVEYRDWLQFFPKHPLADDVMLKIAEIHMRQAQAPDRDTTHVNLAERQIMKMVETFPNSELKQRATDMLWEVREILGMHELKVARFYFNTRQAYKAAASRTMDIVTKYPSFSHADEALFILGRSQVELEDSEEAIKYFTRLCRLYPQSPYYDDAASYLKRLDAPVPEAAPDPERPAPHDGPGMIGRMMENISHPHFDNVSKDGVLFLKKDTTQEALEKALQFKVDQQQTAAEPTQPAK